MLRSRISLNRFEALTAAGKADEAKKVFDRAQELLGKSHEAWQAYLNAPKAGVDQALLDELVTRRATVMRDGVDPEFVALRANDLAGYHAIADTKISPMFVAYDNAATPVIKALQQRASDEQAASQSNIGTMTALIIGVTVLALVMVMVIRFALRGLIVQPLTDAVMAFERIASGDLT